MSGYPRKGYITWPDTAVGRRRLVRCQYAYMEPVFVERDCLLVDVDNTSLLSEAQWYPEFVDMDICPDPPFARHVRQLYDRLVNYYFPCIQRRFPRYINCKLNCWSNFVRPSACRTHDLCQIG